MSLTLYNLQASIFTAIRGDSDLQSLLGGSGASMRAFTAVPQNSAFPYIVFGDDSSGDWGASDIRGQSVDVQIQAFDRPANSSGVAGTGTIKQILGHLHDLFHERDLTITDNSLVYMRHSFSDVFLEDDGRTRQGVIRFTTVVTES